MDDNLNMGKYIFQVLAVVIISVALGWILYHAGADMVAKSECIAAGFDYGIWTGGEIVCTALKSLSG